MHRLLLAGGLAAGLLWLNSRQPPVASSLSLDPGGPGATFGLGAGGILPSIVPGQVNPPDPTVGPPPAPAPLPAVSPPQSMAQAVAFDTALRSSPSAAPPALATPINLPINSNLAAAANAAARAGQTPVVQIAGIPYVVATPGGPVGAATVPQIQRLNTLVAGYNRALQPAPPPPRPAAAYVAVAPSSAIASRVINRNF